MPSKFSRSKIPHPTPPVCKASQPDPSPDIDPCIPTNVQIAVTIKDFNNVGQQVNGAGTITGSNGGSGTVWQSTSVVLGLDIVASIEGRPFPDPFQVFALLRESDGTPHLMASGLWPGQPCPPFHAGPFERPLVPGPGNITLEMYS